MQKKSIMFLCACFVVTCVIASEFVVEKKKSKKELSAQVKEDIASNLEQLLRQTSQLVKNTAGMQNEIFDAIKSLVEVEKDSTFDVSTAQLKKYREKLQECSGKLQELNAHVQTFSSCFS